jgi:hypothetical protein
MHAKVLFTHNEHERLTGLNQWNGGVAPRFYLGRTVMGNVCRFHANLPDELINKLTALCLEETGDILSELKHKEKYIHLLSSHAKVTNVWQGPAYWCSTKVKPTTLPVSITNANSHLLKGGLEDWLPDVPHLDPFVVAVEDGHAVAVCASVRKINEAHEAGVETLAIYRRKGHAVDTVAGWANTLLSKSIIPLYSTSWDNTASQNVAKKLGFSLYGTDFHIT